jgi:hypothetical protein
MTCWLVLVAHIFGLQTVRNRKVPQIYRDIRQPRWPFLWHETNYCGVSLFLVSSQLCGLLHDVFQRVSAHPIPIEICYGMLSDARVLTHFLFVFVCRGWVHPVSVTMHPPPIPLFCFLSMPSVRQQRGITDTFCVCKKKYCTGGRLRFWTVRKFPFHLLSSCLSSWSQERGM